MKRILVVDDDQDILDALKVILSMDHYNVTGTNKGEEAVTLVHGSHPDLILLDVLLSGMDGRDICRKLKAERATKNIPVIMISAHPDAAISTRQAGADCFVAKPFDIDDLLFRIENHLPKN